MSGGPVLVEQSQAFGAPVEQVWRLISGPGAMALRPGSFAFDVTAAPAARLRVVLCVFQTVPTCVAYEVREEVPGQVVSLTVPGRQPGTEEVFTLSVVPERDASRVAIQVRSVGPTLLEDYWQHTLPEWLVGLCDVAEGRAPVSDGRMPAELQAAFTPAALPGRHASASASAAIAAPAEAVWEAVCAPESTALMSRGGWAHAGVVPGTPARQAGEMQYFLWQREDGQLTNALTVVKELSAGRSVLISQVGRTPLEMLYLIEPRRRDTRLELTFRWPTGNPGVLRSMTQTVQHRTRAFKDLIEARNRRGPAG